MRFQVPQFIEVESQVFGPLTVKQFIYLAGGGGLAYLVYVLLPLVFALIIDTGIIVLALMLAFYKVNERPFIYLLESAVKFYTKDKLYIWKKTTSQTQQKANVTSTREATQTNILSTPKLSNNRLKDLAWSLDIKKDNRR